MTFNVQFQDSSTFGCVFSEPDVFGAEMEGVIVGDYDGPYQVTPNNQTQVLATQGKHLANNVVIDPIPSNYGLITWNGSVLTVS